MSLTRRDFMIGAGAAGAMIATGGDEAEAATSGMTAKQQAAYFGPMIEDNGVDFRSTNFKKINARWRRQFVPYDSIEPQGTRGDRCDQPLSLCDLREPDGATLWRRRRARRLPLVWPGAHRPQAAMAALDAAAGNARAASGTAGIYRWRRRPIRLGPAPCICSGRASDLGYRVHGTLEPWSIGTNASSGCIRMFNEDAIDLYQRCPIGTRVLVLKVLGAPVIDEAAPVDTQ